MLMTYWKYLLRLNAQMESEEIMGVITITQEEYKTLLECRIRLNQIVEHLVNSKYIDDDTIKIMAGIKYPLHEVKEDD